MSTYDAASLLQTEQVTTVRTDGTYVANTTYGYVAEVYHSGTGTYTWDGAYQGGSVTRAVTTNTKNGVSQPTSETDYSYDWSDGPVLSGESYTANTALQNPQPGYTTYSFGEGATPRLLSVDIEDGRPRTVTFTTNIDGEILGRDEADHNASTGDPHEEHYFLFAASVVTCPTGRKGPREFLAA